MNTIIPTGSTMGGATHCVCLGSCLARLLNKTKLKN